MKKITPTNIPIKAPRVPKIKTIDNKIHKIIDNKILFKILSFLIIKYIKIGSLKTREKAVILIFAATPE